MSITDDLKRERVYATDGKKRKYQLSAATFEATGGWQDSAFRKEIHGSNNFKMTETYVLSEDGKRLFVIIRIGDPRRPETMAGVNRVYDRISSAPLPERVISRPLVIILAFVAATMRAVSGRLAGNDRPGRARQRSRIPENRRNAPGTQTVRLPLLSPHRRVGRAGAVPPIPLTHYRLTRPQVLAYCAGCLHVLQALSRVAEGTGPKKPQQPGGKRPGANSCPIPGKITRGRLRRSRQ